MDGKFVATLDNVTKQNFQSQFNIQQIVLEDDVSLTALNTNNAYRVANYTVPTIDGFVPVAIVGFDVRNATHDGIGSTCILFSRLIFDMETNIIDWSIRNTGATAAKVKTIVNVMYVRNKE